MITISLEKLRNGNVRATGRMDGRTVSYKEGPESQSKDLTLTIIKDVAWAHIDRQGKVDSDFVELNELAKRAISS